MRNSNIVIVVVAVFCFSMGYMTSRTFRDSYGTNLEVYKENDSLRKQLHTKDSLIFELDCKIDILEEEVSYWGQKYDSLKSVNNWP